MSKPAKISTLRKRWGDNCCLCGEVMEFIDFKTAGKLSKANGTYNPKVATREHLIPVGLGGKHTCDNVRLSHMECNELKHTTPPEEWEDRWEIFVREEQARRELARVIREREQRGIKIAVSVNRAEYQALQLIAGDMHVNEYFSRMIHDIASEVMEVAKEET